MSRYIGKGIFKELRDKRYFRKVRIIAGGIEWPNEQDLSVDTIYLTGKRVAKPEKTAQPIHRRGKA